MKFEIDDEDYKMFVLKDKEHKCTLSNDGTIGGRVSFKFTPTGLGIIAVAKCACGWKYDFTDYNSW